MSVFDIRGENIKKWQVANHLLALGLEKGQTAGEVLLLKQTLKVWAGRDQCWQKLRKCR